MGASGDHLDDLFVVPPNEFVERRNELVRALRAEGRRQDADRIAAYRRPSAVDWALNCVAIRTPSIVSRFADHVERWHDAQAAAVGDPSRRPALRAAMAEARDAASALRLAALAVSAEIGRGDADADAIGALVTEAMGHPALLDRVRSGRLGTGELDDADPLAALPDVDEATAAAAAASDASPGRRGSGWRRGRSRPEVGPSEHAIDDDTGSGSGSRRHATGSEARPAGTSERLAARRRLDRATADHARRQGERDAALERLDAATREARRAEERLDDAARTLAEAEVELARFRA